MAALEEDASLLRVLFDTSVLFSRGNRKAITRLVDRDQPAFKPLWSEWIIAEFNYSLAWRWAEDTIARREGLTETQRNQMGRAAKTMLSMMLEHFEVVSLEGAVPFPAYAWVPDQWDRHLFAAAERGGAQVVVLNDGDVLRASRRSSGWGAITLMSAEDFFAAADPEASEPPEPDER